MGKYATGQAISGVKATNTDQHIMVHKDDDDGVYKDNEDYVSEMWKYLPTEPLILILELLPYRDLGRCCQVCKRWYEIGNLSYLWQKRFRADFSIDPDLSLPPIAKTWKGEYQRVVDLVPSVEFERILEHDDEVLHVSFSNNGMMFCTCSKDAKVKVFSADWPFDTIFDADLGRTSQFRWVYTQYSQFSSSDTQLLVSGRCEGSHQGGEIIIYNIFAKEFTLQARVRIIPYDVMGTWLNENHILSSRAHSIPGPHRCLCEIHLNKSNQEVENLMHSTVTRAFMFNCQNGNVVSYLKVADMTKVICDVHRSINLGCFRGKLHDMHIKAFAQHREAMKEAEKQESMTKESKDVTAQTVSSISIKVAEPDLNNSLKSNNELQDGEKPKLHEAYGVSVNPFLLTAMKRCMTEADNDTDSSNPFSGPTSPQLTDDELDRDDSESTEVTTGDETPIYVTPPRNYKLLLCFTGEEVDLPHKIGIKRVLQEECTDVVRPEFHAESPASTSPHSSPGRRGPQTDIWDHVIDMGGQLIGMSVSPCGRYLYVNVREWTEEPDSWQAPPISTQVKLTMIDLLSMEKIMTFSGHVGESDVFFLHVSCNGLYVCSGSEDKHGYLWDRYYGVLLSKFRHDNVVNCVAINPRDPSMAVSVSDDHSIKIWRSRSFHRLLSAARAKARTKSTNTL